MIFSNRESAGTQLADALNEYNYENPLVLALPRGGVVLGAKVAEKLAAPLGVILVRKLSYPSAPELAMGAMVYGEEPYLDAPMDPDLLAHSVAEADKLNSQRQALYGAEFGLKNGEGKTVIIVDDGIATGLTMRAALQTARKYSPEMLVVGAPVAPTDSLQKLRQTADEVVILDDPANFLDSVGSHYVDFEQVSDEQVIDILKSVNNKH